MAWMTEMPNFDEARASARKALNLPMGMTSPLWIAFGAATTAGVAWWWMSRWARPLNIEALAVAPGPKAETEAAEIDAELQVADQIFHNVQEQFEAEVAQSLAPDDLTRLTGIGPKLAGALNARGVTTFAQLAAWTDDEAAAFDAELKLLGRVGRDAWIAQARRLASA
jgi:predicted flap endonuclease-1-like 5' DNA nuclease